MPGIPRSSPLYPDPPYEYEGAELAVAMYRLPADRAKALLPPGLAPGGLEACLALFAHYPKSTVGPYDEVVFLVSADRGDEAGLFCPFIYVTADAPMAAGREIWGFPKKIAGISVVRKEMAARASLSRGGALVEFAATFDGPADPAVIATLSAAPIYNAKHIPSVTGKDADLAVLTSTILEINPTEALVGSGMISFTGSPDDAWDLLAPQEEEVAAFWLTADSVLPAGQIVGTLD